MSKPMIGCRIDQRTYDYLKAIEKGSGSAISDIIRRALRVYLKTYRCGRIVEPLDLQPKQK